MIKKIFFLLLFLLAFYNYAYADPITIAIGFTLSVLGVGASAYMIAGTITTILMYGFVAYSIYAGVMASQQKDRLKFPSSRYASPVIDNTFSNEGIVPIIYGGPIIVGGNILWQSDPATTVKRFLALSIGEVSAITNVLIDEQDIATLTDCSYTAYYGTSAQTPDSRCDGVVKGLKDIAYLALTLTAGDKVSSNPVASARVTGRKIKTWNSTTNSWDTNAVSASKNPAAIVRDYMLLGTTLGGCGLSESFIDNDSFGDVSEYCDVLIDDGEGGTETRHELTIAIDTKHAVLDNIAKMLVTFNGALIRSGASYKLVIEKSNETAVQAFTEDNITKGTFIYGYGKVEDTPNKLGVEWFSALETKNPKRIAWSEDELDQEVHGVREEKIEALGIIRQSQAIRLAKKILYDRKINDIWCEFESNISAMHCEPMDVVSVTHSRPDWTAALFRIIEINETNFGNAKYSCQAYNSSVLDDRHDSTFDDWDYGSPPNPYEAVTNVTNIALSEVGWLNSDGIWVINIDVTWTAPATKKELLRQYIIELKKGSDAYKAFGVAPASATTFRISGNLKTTETYYVRIKTQSKYDIISDGTVSNPITLVGKTTNPSNVTGFTYSWGKNIELSWDNITDADLVGYEIRNENANFGTDNANLIYRGLANRKVLIPASRAPGHYYIRAINASGYYSLASASIVPENKAPEIPLSLDPIIFFNIARLSWTDDTATDIEYYEVYVSKTNAWAGEENLLAKVPGKNLTVQGECSQNGISDDNGIANTNYITDLDLSGWGPDYWKGSYIEIISGTGSGQELKISAYDTDLGKFTMVDNWATKPDTTSKFFLHAVRYYKVRGVDGFGAGNFTAAIEVKYVEFTEGMLSDQIITARKVYAGEVITLSAQIKDAIITTAKILSLAADKITTGSLVGQILTGGTIQTSAGGARFVITSSSLIGYDNNGNEVFKVILTGADEGDVIFGTPATAYLKWDKSAGKLIIADVESPDYVADTTGYKLSSATGLEVNTGIIKGNIIIDSLSWAGFANYGGDGSDGDVTISVNTDISESVKQYNTLTINAGITLTAKNCIIGVKGKLTVNGTISANGGGYAGGTGATATPWTPGTSAETTMRKFSGGGGGGGGGSYSDANGAGGVGGSAGGAGGAGGTGTHGNGGDGSAPTAVKQGYFKYSTKIFTCFSMGGGGGQGGSDTGNDQIGGAGGGFIIIECNNFDFNTGAIISANGNTGTSGSTPIGGGGGGGGTILVRYKTIEDNLGTLQALGGAGGADHGGDGGAGSTYLEAIS